jgi:capsular exopolysaccharide synthesis family protein
MSEDPHKNETRSGQLARSSGKPGGISSPGATTGPSGPGALALTHDHDPRRISTVPNLWRMAHSALRGRYLLMAVLGAVSATGLALAAYHWTAKPIYTSEVWLRIEQSTPGVREGATQNESLPVFEAYVQQQKQLIASRPVAERAANDPVIWQHLPEKKLVDFEKYYKGHLLVDVKGQMLNIKVIDTDPQMAANAANALLNGYITFEASQQKEKRAVPVLEEKRRELKAKLEKLDQQIRARAEPYGTTQLDNQFQQLQASAARFKSSLEGIQIEIAETVAAAPPRPVTPGNTPAPAPANELSLEQIVAADQVVRNYWEQQNRYQEEVDRYTRYGYGKSHRLMVAATRGLEDAKARTQKAADEYRRANQRPNAAQPVVRIENGQPTVARSGRSIEDLKTIEARFKELYQNASDQLAAVGKARLDLADWEGQRNTVAADLASVNREIERYADNRALGGRLSIISKGEVPIIPTKDNRPLAAGLAGGIGFFLPTAILMALSLVQRRYRYSDEPGTDYVMARTPLLGMLPEVSRNSPGPLRLAAAYAAHHLRVLLSSRATTVVKRTFLVTSAGEGEGKTTVTMALAISFAAAKHRTLVIDGDFVSRRLTRGFNAEQQEGLFESLGHGDIDGQWLNAASNLCILPTGRVDAADACGITAENVRLLLEQAVQHFDVVLIDTGSILGGPESAVLAREVDGVIVTIERGQQQSQVRKAMLRLEALGAMVVGTIFNRADIADFQSSYVTPVSGWTEPRRPESTEVSELQQRVANFGPLVRAVAEAVPSDSSSEGARV